MAKTKGKAKAEKVPLMGHNSEQNAIDEELRKVAKAQRSLDKEKKSVKADWRTREKTLTERLEKVGYTRAQFKEPYSEFCELADCKDDAEAETIRQNHLIFLAKQRKAFNALGQGAQTDWVNLVQDAEEIEKLRDAQERRAAEEAAASAEEGEETSAEAA